MIPYFLVLIVIAIISVILFPFTRLPDATLPPALAAGVSAAGQSLGFVYNIAPVTFAAVLATIVLILAVEGYIFGYKVVMWVIKKIPTIN